MKKLSACVLLILLVAGCKKDRDFLTNQPYTLLTSGQAFSSVDAATSVLAGLYGSYVDLQTITNYGSFTQFDEAYPSGGNANVKMASNYVFSSWQLWNYDYIRNINLFIQLCDGSPALAASDKAQLTAEAKFLRAANYFELAKRMGGVPLILKPLTYDFSGKVDTLLYARVMESDVYDFVINTMDTLKAILPASASIQDRATRGACLAMQARAALYAASIAQYGVGTPSVTLPGGIVGIPAAKATAYYQKALSSAQELMSDGTYSLYLKTPSDLTGNFANLFLDKSNNPEVIFVRNFKLKSGSVQNWTLFCQPHAGTEEAAENGELNPSLNLAMQYEMLDNTYQPFKTTDNSGNLIYYADSTALFSGRDARLAATFILPGSQFKGRSVDIWAGYMLPNGSTISSGTYGGLGTLPGQPFAVPVVGQSGPIDGLPETAETGFYVRKFLDPTPGSGTIGTQSEVWWVRYRYAEVLLNAAEAAFALGNAPLAAQYINMVRARAGLIIPLQASDITFDRIVHERRVELAFEGHELFDNKRWRIADKVWNGQPVNVAQLESGIGKAVAPNTQIWALYPFKIYDPGGANDAKWVYKKVKPSMVTGTYNFALGNYYSQISADTISSNPKLVQNPNQ
jgi:hypothetical protein